MGSGSDIRFWEKVWIGDWPLKEVFRSIYQLVYYKEGFIAENFVHDLGGAQMPRLRRNSND